MSRPTFGRIIKSARQRIANAVIHGNALEIGVDRNAEASLNPEKTEPFLSDLFFSFLRLGLTAFGGPAMVAQIADLAVKRKKWLDQDTFKQGVVLCQSLPGATAMQAAAYVGLRARGPAGALLSYVGFGFPAFLLMLIFSSIYLASHDVSWMRSLFAGLQVIVVALVAMATYTFGRTSLKKTADVIFAVASAIAFWFSLSPFHIIIGAAIAGISLSWGKRTRYPDLREETNGPIHHISNCINADCSGRIVGTLFLQSRAVQVGFAHAQGRSLCLRWRFFIGSSHAARGC